jgi:hypothetical protein
MEVRLLGLRRGRVYLDGTAHERELQVTLPVGARHRVLQLFWSKHQPTGRFRPAVLRDEAGRADGCLAGLFQGTAMARGSAGRCEAYPADNRRLNLSAIRCAWNFFSNRVLSGKRSTGSIPLEAGRRWLHRRVQELALRMARALLVTMTPSFRSLPNASNAHSISAASPGKYWTIELRPTALTLLSELVAGPGRIISTLEDRMPRSFPNRWSVIAAFPAVADAAGAVRFT